MSSFCGQATRDKCAMAYMYYNRRERLDFEHYNVYFDSSNVGYSFHTFALGDLGAFDKERMGTVLALVMSHRIMRMRAIHVGHVIDRPADMGDLTSNAAYMFDSAIRDIVYQQRFKADAICRGMDLPLDFMQDVIVSTTFYTAMHKYLLDILPSELTPVDYVTQALWPYNRVMTPMGIVNAVRRFASSLCPQLQHDPVACHVLRQSLQMLISNVQRTIVRLFCGDHGLCVTAVAESPALAGACLMGSVGLFYQRNLFSDLLHDMTTAQQGSIRAVGPSAVGLVAAWMMHGFVGQTQTHLMKDPVSVDGDDVVVIFDQRVFNTKDTIRVIWPGMQSDRGLISLPIVGIDYVPHDGGFDESQRIAWYVQTALCNWFRDIVSLIINDDDGDDDDDTMIQDSVYMAIAYALHRFINYRGGLLGVGPVDCLRILHPSIIAQSLDGFVDESVWMPAQLSWHQITGNPADPSVLGIASLISHNRLSLMDDKYRPWSGATPPKYVRPFDRCIRPLWEMFSKWQDINKTQPVAIQSTPSHTISDIHITEERIIDEIRTHPEIQTSSQASIVAHVLAQAHVYEREADVIPAVERIFLRSLIAHTDAVSILWERLAQHMPSIEQVDAWRTVVGVFWNRAFGRALGARNANDIYIPMRLVVASYAIRHLVNDLCHQLARRMSRCELVCAEYDRPHGQPQLTEVFLSMLGILAARNFPPLLNAHASVMQAFYTAFDNDVQTVDDLFVDCNPSVEEFVRASFSLQQLDTTVDDGDCISLNQMSTIHCDSVITLADIIHGHDELASGLVIDSHVIECIWPARQFIVNHKMGVELADQVPEIHAVNGWGMPVHCRVQCDPDK